MASCDPRMVANPIRGHMNRAEGSWQRSLKVDTVAGFTPGQGSKCPRLVNGLGPLAYPCLLAAPPQCSTGSILHFMLPTSIPSNNNLLTETRHEEMYQCGCGYAGQNHRWVSIRSSLCPPQQVVITSSCCIYTQCPDPFPYLL